MSDEEEGARGRAAARSRSPSHSPPPARFVETSSIKVLREEFLKTQPNRKVSQGEAYEKFIHKFKVGGDFYIEFKAAAYAGTRQVVKTFSNAYFESIFGKTLPISFSEDVKHELSEIYGERNVFVHYPDGNMNVRVTWADPDED